MPEYDARCSETASNEWILAAKAALDPRAELKWANDAAFGRVRDSSLQPKEPSN